MALTAVARIAKQARSAFHKLFSPRMLAVSFKVVGSGRFDFVRSVHVDPAGMIRLAGRWKEGFDERDVPKVFLDGQAIPFLQSFTKVEFGRLVAFRINDTEFYASLSAVCWK